MSEKKMKEYRRKIREKFGALHRDKKGGRNTPAYQAYKEMKRGKHGTDI